ncbi:RNA-BINDING MOTIF PROTEIN X-LINKED 2 [Salix purpurea]|uniref:RNA-BINDING MOTIF PROTEIN X-LINKED 2 n=1 Tax=Salix purpurea TaxID=77065 RepID=A0A9Q0PP62_SALPP|nr:RNA-BINDING MOTIF PROTEIN X-LINKED 2 [Salix purpurea]
MNPLTLVKRIQNINSKEAALGISEEASWHAKYKDSAYVFVGGIPFDLTEGDLLAVFAQYGEVVDVNLVRDKGTGKSKGFAFLAYEDQRSTNLAVDNLNGAQVLGRIIRVDHVTKYKKKEEEDEETAQQKREARGVCHAFQRGECNRGAGCKFSHDEQRAANTGWGAQDKSPRWGNEMREEKRSSWHDDNEIVPKPREDNNRREDKKLRRLEDDAFVPKPREDDYRRGEDRLKRHKDIVPEPKSRGDNYRKEEKISRRQYRDEFEPRSREDDDTREPRRSRRNETESFFKEEQDKRRGDKLSAHGRDSSSNPHRERDDHRRKA